ncbi:MAG TPA: cytochrome C biogenesis protein [Marinilabiliales bacterium]|nr:MAG: cytochrome C biogenesis protein [Bacteroidetes bacterium GWA2_40_14]OFX60584.1 MAG: cytochrome C biogenesis protein [Bacteroidetes bacterium GWC2_40_13]OFX71093.1 MAG: cytochrome C biogenesis protein [Bacteroidetes bacterium GWD2_40_43]OFX92424.1 MAG: cytochrome C biogenesis protein [Bacteroidetes bacterium GWE2_40_63]OFY23026.1 MAG: cytochrome C biogenesis protein [Bacteroidetes bacterium GWF2_40_13]OFZ29883.1 MAG: cytochrome C biogenesis protein [Bacteroidetes bacterium RIFOXYC2_FULL
MEFFQQLLESAEWPVLSAFLLGLMTAISPCPLATNITAVGFISKDIENRRRVFLNGVIYTLGRAFSYTALGLAFFFGAGKFHISGFLQQNGEKIIGPLLIVIGLFMLDVLNIRFPGLSRLSEKIGSKNSQNPWGVFLLGVVFALAFCPYSGVLFFGMLIPMTIASTSGLYLPIVFAIATGIPVILFAWLIAFSIGSLGNFYNRLKTFELWFRRVIGLLFIGVGAYYVVMMFF